MCSSVSDASRQLRDGNAEEKVQAMTTLSRYLPDQSVDSLSKELRVENDPTVQKVRQNTKARENMQRWLTLSLQPRSAPMPPLAWPTA